MVNRYDDAGGGNSGVHSYAPRLCERARDFKTCSVNSTLNSKSIESYRCSSEFSHESCGYVNIPEVRIDIHSAGREHPVLQRSFENCERVLDLSTITLGQARRLNSRLARVCPVRRNYLIARIWLGPPRGRDNGVLGSWFARRACNALPLARLPGQPTNQPFISRIPALPTLVNSESEREREEERRREN